MPPLALKVQFCGYNDIKRALKDSGSRGSGSAEKSGTFGLPSQGPVETLRAPLRSSLSSPEPPDRPGHVYFKGGLAFI